MEIKSILIVAFFIIMVSIQYTLNQILKLLKEIKIGVRESNKIKELNKEIIDK